MRRAENVLTKAESATFLHNITVDYQLTLGGPAGKNMLYNSRRGGQLPLPPSTEVSITVIMATTAPLTTTTGQPGVLAREK